ncbi:5-histidylcysteine sulfoxide synthase [Colwellia sp. D2M02]|uniref:5-histidylcysteine sulfoxide synthase n=1 Tax=Colwellia sp. D2M02 TaxID=2841562 RepID=UPI001C08D880|nr:5-histidylcysteine sulfoxide synthase [Colwellia sp. D2M02]MBU2894545.1 5-histidylcysteine sulfoxide synthase [Colwellia sp. D2M02]
MNIYNQKNKLSYPKSPLLCGDCSEQKRAELKHYFKSTWQSYDSLFSLINNDEFYYQRPEPLRHPLIFYFGHTACFYINKLILGKYTNERVNPRIEAICAVGVDEMSWDDLNSDHYDWPSVDEVRQYRQQVFALVNELIDNMELSLPISKNSIAWIILMGCEHERIHIETSSVIMRMLPLSALTENEQWQTCLKTAQAPINELVPVGEAVVNFGKPEADKSYGWDNEYGHEQLTLNEFHASKFLVSNAEFMSFVEGGGYENPLFWTEEGQEWLAFSKASMPRFWCKKSGEYYQRNLLSQIPLPLDWPVEVNYLEAKAFCQWKNSKANQQGKLFYRLPTEGEWLCLREQVDGDLLSWQQAPGNINCEFYASPCPVNQFKQGEFYDIVGNVWQWTESAIDGFTGFSVHPLYDDFSTPTFDGKHNLIKGGSWISSGNEAMRYSRYAFRRHFFQHAGFRYVASHSDELPNLPDNHFETDKALCQQLHHHFEQLRRLGQTWLNVSEQNVKSEAPFESDYLQSLANIVLKNVDSYGSVKVPKCLDLGCSIGGLSFLLAQHATFIDALDFSARFIKYGVKLQQGDTVRYTTTREGELLGFNEYSLPDTLREESQNIHFIQGDLCNLKTIFTGYDVIVVQNVLEKSYDPKLFLDQVHQRLNFNGLLVIISSYDFDEQFTDKAKWLGGKKINGENVTGFEALSESLSKYFTLLDKQTLTQVYEKRQRHFTVVQPQLTVWQLNN